MESGRQMDALVLEVPSTCGAVWKRTSAACSLLGLQRETETVDQSAGQA